MDVFFDTESHTYSHGDIVFPSVTQILPESKFYCSHDQLEHARDDGIEKHSMIKSLLDSERAGYVFWGNDFTDAFCKWKKDNFATLGKVVEHEKPMISKKHKFAGTPDIVFERAIVDLKRSPGNWKRHSLQLSGYLILAVENGLIKKTKSLIVLWYDGREFKHKNVFDPLAESLFISLVKKHYINQEVEKWMRGN